MLAYYAVHEGEHLLYASLMAGLFEETGHFILSLVERLAAITAQIGLSVIVWLTVAGIALIAGNVWKK